MNKKRAIIIRIPCLRQIRNNLRTVILKTNRTIQHELLDKIMELKSIEGYYENHPPKLLDEVRHLKDKEKKIERALRASILLCPVCFQADKDMTYNPVRKVWYCTECYGVLKKGNEERGTPEEFP